MAPNKSLTEQDAFDELDTDLNLDPSERLKAQTIHNDIGAVLRSKGLIASAFLQGSLARKTMIKPLRDIDKCVIVHPDLWGPAHCDGGADWVMDQIERCLSEKYRTRITFDRSAKHALKVTFAAETFTFDIVPAFETTDGTDDINIANRETDIWERSNTRELIRFVQDRNKATGGRFIHQVRMGKHLVRHLIDGTLPGLHVESVAYQALTEELDHATALHRLLCDGARILAGDYCEPTGRELISRRLKPVDKERARQCFTAAAIQASEARRLADAGDHQAALQIWFGLLGEPFLEPLAQSADSALKNAFLGGTVTTAGTVSATRHGHQPSRPTRSWRRS